MAKVYDISKKITNERPTLKLGEDKVYEIDDRKNTVLLLDQKVREDNTGDIAVLDDIIEMMLGKEAAKEIDHGFVYHILPVHRDCRHGLLQGGVRGRRGQVSPGGKKGAQVMIGMISTRTGT